MVDIFLSYTKERRDDTKELALELENLGYSVWWDTSLLGGDEFPEIIKRNIASAKIVIVLWNPASIKSQWVYAEAQLGHRLGKLMPLRTDDLPETEIPVPFSILHTIPQSSRDEIFASLVRRGVFPLASTKPNAGDHPRNVPERCFVSSQKDPFVTGKPIRHPDNEAASLITGRESFQVLSDQATAWIRDATHLHVISLESCSYINSKDIDDPVSHSILGMSAQGKAVLRKLSRSYAHNTYGHGRMSEIEILENLEPGLAKKLGWMDSGVLYMALSESRDKVVVFEKYGGVTIVDLRTLEVEHKITGLVELYYHTDSEAIVGAGEEVLRFEFCNFTTQKIMTKAELPGDFVGEEFSIHKFLDRDRVVVCESSEMQAKKYSVVNLKNGSIECNFRGRWCANIFLSRSTPFAVLDRRRDQTYFNTQPELQQRGESPLELWHLTNNSKIAEFGTEYRLDLCALPAMDHFSVIFLDNARSFVTPGIEDTLLIRWDISD